MKLSILICTIPSRQHLFNSLLIELNKQANKLNWKSSIDYEILYSDDEFLTIGEKRNFLLEKATGEYLCFFDDDDSPGSDYFYEISLGIKNNLDCCSLRGIITFDGKNPEIFEHSIRYKEYKTTKNKIKYERFPNHLNCIKSSIAKQFKFPGINFGEDTDWATQIFNSKLIKSEYYSNKIIYFYNFKTQK